MISIFLNLLRFNLWSKMWFTLENVPCALEKKVYSSEFGWIVLKISMKSISSNVSFKTCVFLLIFYFDDLSIGCEWGVNISYYYCVNTNFSFFCLLVLVLCIESYLGYIDIYNCYVFFLDWSFDYYIVSFLSLVIFFNLRYILSDMRISTPAFFCFPFAWNIFLHHLTFSI